MIESLYSVVHFYRNWSGQTIGDDLVQVDYEDRKSLWRINARRHKDLVHATMLEF